MYSYSALYNQVLETFPAKNEKEKTKTKISIRSAKLIPIYEIDEKSKQA